MAKDKLPTLKDDEVVRVLRHRCIQASADAFKECEIETQLSIERSVVWMIHAIEFDFENISQMSPVAANDERWMAQQVTRESKSTIVNSDDTDLLQKSKIQTVRSAAIGTDAGPLWITNDTIRIIHYPKPLLYAGSKIYWSVDTENFTAAVYMGVRVFYTIAKVDDKQFFRVASSLLS